MDIQNGVLQFDIIRRLWIVGDGVNFSALLWTSRMFAFGSCSISKEKREFGIEASDNDLILFCATCIAI